MQRQSWAPPCMSMGAAGQTTLCCATSGRLVWTPWPGPAWRCRAPACHQLSSRTASLRWMNTGCCSWAAALSKSQVHGADYPAPILAWPQVCCDWHRLLSIKHLLCQSGCDSGSDKWHAPMQETCIFTTRGAWRGAEPRQRYRAVQSWWLYGMRPVLLATLSLS